MRSFRRVFAERAGSNALGILVPPGNPTTVIVRPRALEWDLLVARLLANDAYGVAFLEADRRQAETIAQELCDALEHRASRVEAIALEPGDGFGVAAEVGPFTLIACRRDPGQPYRPATFSEIEAAHTAVDAIVAVLCPDSGCEREVYFNTRNFAR